MKITHFVKSAANTLRKGKRIAAITAIFATFSIQSFAQCTTSSLDISTGMDATGGSPTAVPAGSNDPKWIVTNITADITAIVTGLPATPYAAVSVNPIGTWATPAANTNWISFYSPSTWYSTTGPSTYGVTVRRYFKLCQDEELNISLNGARDNYISDINLDGSSTLFTEAASLTPSNYNTISGLVGISTITIPAGTHYIEITFNNYHAATSNPHGLYINGTISTFSGNSTIVTDQCENCDDVVETCSDKCYWRVEGNNINGNKNLFGTLTDHDVRVITNKSTPGMPDRGVIKGGDAFTGGFLGWNTTVPTARLHVNCERGNNPEYQPGLPSDIRFERLEPGEGNILVIDREGYVYDSGVPLKGGADGTLAMQQEIRDLKTQLAELRQALATGNTGMYNAQVQNELYQNNPNPFGQETSIGYNIVNMQQGAFIAIYDLNGKELFRQPVTEKGKGSVTVSGDKLVPGMYLYSLIVDGKETATKRMVVTK